MSDVKVCPSCSVAPGRPHEAGCDVARCLFDGRQRIQCDQEDHGDCGQDVWTGEWPGTVECREFGWLDGDGWPDLNRLFSQGRWDREHARWVLR